MEAVPRLPMICFDLKISPDRFPPEFVKLKQYIREFYHEDPETYSSEIRNLETLRANAVHPAKDATGCEVLKKYFCQLHFLQSRFPIGRDTVAIPFVWKDTYGGVVSTTADIKFEMSNILYNIGALHSQLGAGDDRSTPEGLKMACTHFQCAAWAFQHLKDSFPQPTGLDISPDLMQFMYQLCLAQAQECILEKSMTDNRKATINAKVAAQIVDYYNLALNALLQGPSDDGSIIDIVGSRLFKSWKKYMKFKVSYYSCISLLYQGMQSEEQQKMGERIAYYQGALDKLNDAIKLAKGLDYGEVISEALVFTRDVVEGKRKAAKNENDFIYHEDIPELDSLPIIKGASLVKGIPFNVNDPEISGPDIFARLVPMKAHEVSSLYSEEKAKLLRRISSMIDSKDEEVVSYMSSLQLDYLKAHLDTGPALPQEVVDRCAALSAKPDAIPSLIAAMDKLSDAYHDVDGMLKEVMELIKIEEISEKEYQEIMGPRPPSIVATDLTREANKYMEAHKKAAESNETLHKAMTQHIENLRVLQQPLEEIARNLPSLDSLNLRDDSTVREVITLVDKVGEMRKQRAMLASQLRESICSDDITRQLVTRTDEKHEDIFEKEMQKHNKYVSLIEQNLAAQENIIPALTDAYAKYAATRKAVTEIMRQREMMLSALISSYDAYEDLIMKSNKGLEFYRKLETNLTKLLQRVKGTCKVQQEERDTILAQHNKKLEHSVDTSAISSSTSSTGSGLKLKDYLQSRKTAQAAASSYYPGQVSAAESQQTWLPSVRPAPLGSEGTSSTNQADYVPSSYGNMASAYGAYAQTAYGADYSKEYMASYYQNPLSVDLQNLQYPSVPGAGSAMAANSVSTPSPKLYSNQVSSNPYAYSPSSGTHYANYDPSAVPSQYPPGQVPSQSQASHSELTKPPLEQQYNSSYQYPETNPAQPHDPSTGTAQSYTTGQPYSGPAASGQTYPGTTPSYQAPDPSNYQTPGSLTQNSISQSYPASVSQTYSTVATQSYESPSAQTYTTSSGYVAAPVTQSYQIPPTQNYQTPSTGIYSGSTPSYQAQSSQNYPTPPTGSHSTLLTQTSQASSAQNYQAPTTQDYQTSVQNYQNSQVYSTTSTLEYQGPSQTYQSNQNSMGQSSVNYQVPSTQNYSVSAAHNYQGSNSQTTLTQVQGISTGQPQLYLHSQNPYISNAAGAYDNTTQQLNSSYQANIPYSDYSGAYQYSSQWPQGSYTFNSNSVAYTSGQQPTVTQPYSGANPPASTSYAASMTGSNISSIPTSTFGTSALSSMSQNVSHPTQGPYSISGQANYITIPTTSASINYANYYSEYSNIFPNVQFQGTPGTDTSHYSNAGGKNTSETNSASITPEGLSYASQYIASTVPSEYQNYYASPYGYQTVGPNSEKPTTEIVQTLPNQPNSLTYMQASNNGMKLTFSQQQNGAVISTPDLKKQPSNLDLLTGLDFSLTSTPPLQPVQPENKLIEQSQEKLANLTIEPKYSSNKQPTPNEIDNKNKQSHENGSTSSLEKIERPSPSKTPLKDLFSDPEVLSQFVQEVEKFEKFVEGLNSKTLNGPTPLDIKWNELQDLQDKDAHKQIISVARCYPMKNRFPDFLPYDKSRVELPSTKDDYINASHVKDLRPYTPNFIITQAPLPSTYADFWTMVIEQHVEIIICLLVESQMNGEIYWAVNKTEDLIIGKIKVSLQSVNPKPHWIERIMSVSDGKTSRVVIHLQFTSWPHSWMPESPSPFLSLVTEGVNVWSQQRGRGPVVVHCDSGVGRSGLFVLLTLVAADLGASPHLPDPITLTAQVAAFRKNPLRDRAHLAFAYHCILYYARDLLMKRGILASRSTFDEKRPKTKSHTRHPSEDFLLNSLTKDHNEERRQSDGSTTGSGSKASTENDPLSQLDPLWQIKRS